MNERTSSEPAAQPDPARALGIAAELIHNKLADLALADVEDGLLGAILLSPDALDLVGNRLSSSDFRDRDLGMMFELMLLLHETGKDVSDATILRAAMKHHGIYDAVGGPARIARWVNMAVAANALQYAEEMVRLSQSRKLVDTSMETIRSTVQPKADVQKILDQTSARLDMIAGRSAVRIKRIDEVARATLVQIRANSAESRTSGLTTSLPTLDKHIGGLCKGELIVLAARPGVGKTSFAMQTLLTLASEGTRVLFASLEMRDQELATRVLCSLTGANNANIRAGTLEPDMLDTMDRSIEQWLKDIPLDIFDPPQATCREIRAAAKLAGGKESIQLLCVDYLNRVTPSDPRRQRVEQVAQISGDLKSIAKELQIPVLALCQLNRAADGERPKLAHLKESSAIEQDADAVIAIHPTKEDEVELLILKNRHGPTGKVTTGWDPDMTRFIDPTRRYS